MKPGPVTAALIGLFGVTAAPEAQEATERFIPIGESPGLSGTRTMIGEIRSVDSTSRTLTIVAGDRTYVVVVTEDTRIWIDRSAAKLPAMTGDFEDCDRGEKVEVKLEEGETRQPATEPRPAQPAADWIKVEHASP